MASVPVQTGRTSADAAGNGWLPPVDLPWNKMQAGKWKGAVTDARHNNPALKKGP